MDDAVKSPQLLAIRLIHDAEAYVECAQLLDKVQGGAPKFHSPTYFLLCQSIELTLKAYLAASGVSAKRLRDQRMRHNIELLFRYARRCFGLAPPILVSRPWYGGSRPTTLTIPFATGRGPDF